MVTAWTKNSYVIEKKKIDSDEKDAEYMHRHLCRFLSQHFW